VKAFISICLSFLLLFSTVGMAKTTHWCMGHEMESVVGFGEKHLDCGMEMPAEQENSGDASADPDSCCKNTTQHLQVDDDFQVSQLDFQLNPIFILPFVQVFVVGFDFFAVNALHFPAESSPDPPKRDFQLLYQTFLI
jgi:hypothetical protein